MPLPSFVNNLATKAQSAIQSQMQPRPGSPNESGQPTANQAAGQQQPAQQRSHAFEALQYQFKSLKEQYQATTPVQKVITAEKGFAIDFDSAARDAKAQSKELYTWGQTEPEDLKDGVSISDLFLCYKLNDSQKSPIGSRTLTLSMDLLPGRSHKSLIYLESL